MAKTMDPAFQGAPNLGGTSYNPIEFARRHNMQKFQIEKARREEEAKNTAQGLQDLMVQVKGWEDNNGFKEIMADQDRLRNGFLELSRKGLNLVSPKTTQELMAYKALSDEHQKLKQKVDMWNQQKGVYDLYSTAIQKDSALPEDQQKIDREATIANIQKVLKSKGIMERGTDLQNLVVTKLQPADVAKDIIADRNIFEKPTSIQNVTTDPETGQQTVQTVERLTPEQEKENIRKASALYGNKPKAFKEAIKRMREADTNPAMNVLSDKDYYVTLAVPTYKEKFLDRPVSSGSGMSLNFLGSQAKISPGELHTNDQWYGGRNYNERYDITANKSFKVPTTGGFQHDFDPKPGTNDDGWHPITGGDDVEAEIRFYDPKTDVIVFRATSSAENPWVKNNTTFAVPRKNVPDAEKLPIIVDGKRKTLKDILPVEKQAPALRTIGGKDFRSATPYIPKNRK